MECKVTAVVTASNFYVINISDVGKRRKIEFLLQEEAEAGSIRPGVDNNIKYVAVDHDKRFKRGKLIDLLDSSSQIFLLDYGTNISVENTKLYPLPASVIEDLKPLAFKISLFGVFPTNEVETNDGEKKKRIVDTWSEQAKVHFSLYFEKNPDIILENIEKVGDTIFCNIYLNDKECGHVPLKDILLRKYNGCYLPEVFRKTVMGLSSAESLTPISKKIVKVSSPGSQSSSSVAEGSCNKNEETSSLSGSCTSSVEDARRRRSEMSKTVLKLQRKSSGSKSSQKDDSTSEAGSSAGPEKTPKFSPSNRFNHGYFSGGSDEKENKCEVVNVDSLRKQKERIGIDEKLLDNEMPISANVDKTEVKKSIFEDLLKEDRSKVKPAAGFNFIPAGKLRKGQEKPKKQENQAKQPSPHSSNKSGGSDSGPVRVKETRQTDSTRADSLICTPSSQRLSSRFSSFSEYSSGNRSGRLEEVKLNKDYLLSEGVTRESISSNQSISRPLVLCSDVQVEPVHRFLDLKILPDIVTNLHSNNYTELKGVQKWAIPAISRLSNTVIIGSRKGKTLSYVVPLINFVQDKTNFEELPEGNGPYVVILSSSSKSVHKIYETCHMVLGNDFRRRRFRSKVEVHYAYGGGAEQEKWVDLTNGCRILITTPHCLVRLLDHFVITNFERLCCLVIDEADILTEEPYMHQLKTIFKIANTVVKNRPLQKILCSRIWTPPISAFVKTIETNHVLIFGTHIEAAVYARLKPHLLFFIKEERVKKQQDLFSKLKDKFNKEKILIVSENAQEIIKLGNFLRKECEITPLIAHEDLLATDLKKASTTWKTSNRPEVLCCTDAALRELKIDDAQTLVHYSLPYKSKTNFGDRFSSLMRNYQRYYASSKDTEGSSTSTSSSGKDLSVYICIDHENHIQLPHVVEFALRLGGRVRQDVMKKSEEIKIRKELDKGKLPICKKILEFGKCASQETCSQRHAFDKAVDSPKYLPTSGNIVFQVLTVHDACRFSARILEHYDSENNKTGFNSDYMIINMKLSKFYKNEQNRRPHGLPQIGDICAVLDEEKNVFQRAQVIEYAKVDEHDQPLEVYVRLMDIGKVLRKLNRELYEISEELALYRPQAVDIVLCGVLPTDFDTNWGVPAVKLSEKLLMQTETNEQEKWFGRIVLALNNTLCLDPIHLCEFLLEVKSQIFKFSLKDRLLEEKYAVPNNKHLKLIYQLCEEADIKVPKLELSKPAETTVNPEWAFLDSDMLKCRFLSALSTSAIFVQNFQYFDLLQKLEAECTREAKRIIRRKDHINFEIRPKKYCLARYSSGNGEPDTYNRARIEKIIGEEMVEVFYVDYGDYLHLHKNKDDIVPISDKFVKQLPFQAIECSLIGMEPEVNSSEEVMDEVYGFANQGSDLIWVNYISNDLKPIATEGRKYSINLLNKKGASLNKLLIEKKLVTPIESELHNAVDIEIVNSDDENEKEDVEEELDWDTIAAEREKRKQEEKEAEEELVKKLKAKEIDAKSIKSKGSSDSGSTPCNEEMVCGWTEEDLEKLMDEDEEARRFFHSLATQVRGPSDELDEVFNIKKEKKADINQNDYNNDKNNVEIKKAVQLPPRSQITKLLMNLRRKGDPSKFKQPPQVILPEGVFAPEVHWIQSHSDVTMRIILTDVKEHRFEISPNSLIFCCSLDEKLYALELRLFGTINPEMTEIEVKGREVEVVLHKLCSEMWPRLVLDKLKHPNIRFDVDRVPDKNESLIDFLVKEASEKLRKGIVVKPNKNYSNVEPVDWEEDDFEGEDELDIEQDEESSDPHDFLAD